MHSEPLRRPALVGLPDAVQRLLGAGGAGRGFLEAQHGEAARRLARLVERAQLRQRVTMAYDPARIGGRGGSARPGDLADSAAEARQQLNRLAGALPGDCWTVLIDCCGLDKGLQQIEQEHGWPRRSAKLVLRIGLDQLAQHWGMGAVAAGRQQGRLTAWLPERPAMFPDEGTPPRKG